MNRFIVVDFETTGSHPRQGDSIIQIGAVTIDEGVVTGSFSTLINPGQAIPPFIQQLTGITDEMVADAPTLEDILPKFLPMLEGRTFVAHNASFDLQFLQDALLSQGYYTFDGYVLDTVELSRFLLPMQGSYRLGELADDLQIEHDRPHQADSDAIATAQLFLHLLHILEELPMVTIQRLQMLVSSFRSDLSELLRFMELQKLASLDEFAAKMAPESAEEQPQTQSGAEKWDVYRQLALRKKPERLKASLKRGGPNLLPFDDMIEQMIAERAAIAQNLPGYQRREAQESMMRAVYQTMATSRHLLVEAGTGTGKSLGYLLPAILWAKQQGEPVIISTNTIQLQEQLFHKEIPALKQSLPFSFRAATLKGRGNYLCLRKFEQTLEEPTEGSSQELLMVKGQMVTWLTQTETGDVEELSMPSAGQLYWQQVKSDTDSCLHRKCPWFSRCFYFQARERAGTADLLIVNHALLVTDLQAEHRILPAHDVVIIDEAHHLENAATHHMGKQFSTAGLLFLLDRANPEAGSYVERFAHALHSWMQQESGSSEASFASNLEKMSHEYVKLKDPAMQLTQLLYQWASDRGEETSDTGRDTVRYRISHFSGKHEKIRKTAQKLIEHMSLYGAGLDMLVRSTPPGEKVPYEVSSLFTDVSGLLNEWQTAMEMLHFFLLEPTDEYMCWMEIESRTPKKQVFFYAAPLHVAQNLAEPLFEEKKSVVLTSATLTVKDSFTYIMERMGLDRLPEDRVQTLQLPSVFDYEKQGLLLIPSGLPTLGKESEQEYLHAVIQGCIDTVRAAGGRTMILFTSYSMLRQVYQGMKEQLSDEPFTLLGHGIDSNNRTKLVRMFQSLEHAVLLGTSSFWEGVDIPGDALSCLVIVRLPFTPPNHPVYQARAEELKEHGKNAFMSLALPQAVIQFKQGVGRLIRHQDDRGVVIVLDTRIVESRYGRSFLKSLPPFDVHTGSWLTLREMIVPFLGGMQSLPDS
ncbi:ATP-dependent DNA helicase DinG [Brevibacillus ruminantium]|uniref:3'-5' exonuclease DinG n=1 Tax=Brevibacillus ruminantium TaxID=2950604 RepID=A0ABY4WBE4_9BACL|nr:ATP-dependent DNA helicase DinG [Brevibacillus ruminantium]USG63473.1 ATP-dependent DNA helicase DinG [Brevibacillus ruminantium]